MQSKTISMADKPLQVLLISPKPPPRGGMGVWTENVLAQAACRTDIMVHHVDITPRWRRIHQLGYLHRLLGGLIQGFFDVVRVFMILSARPIKAICLASHGSLGIIRDNLILTVAFFFSVPAYYHLHFGRLPEIIRANGWEWKWIRRAMRSAHSVVVLDKASENAIKTALPGVWVRRIPNGILLEGAIPASELSHHDVLEILYVGWMLATKGVWELVKAWSGTRSIPSRLVLIGPGDVKLLGALRQFAEVCGMGDRIEIAGEMEHAEVMERIRNADIFVLPSYTEGFPNVILEAMSCGKAIVATPVGAIPEMLDAGVATPCGLLVPPREVEPLRIALETLLSDSNLRQELGSRARAKVEREYALSAMFKNLIYLWLGV